MLGGDLDAAFAELANALAPAGASREDAALRHAMMEVLADLYSECALSGRGLSQLAEIDASLVERLMQKLVVACVWTMWLAELGSCIERGTVTSSQAVSLEREVRNYVADVVQLEFDEVDLFAINWNETQGRALVERLFREAYQMLEAE